MLFDLSREMQVLVFADRKGDFDRVDLRNRREQGGRADQIADLGLRDSGDAIDWREHLGPFQVELRGLDRRLGRLDLRPQLARVL